MLRDHYGAKKGLKMALCATAHLRPSQTGPSRFVAHKAIFGGCVHPSSNLGGICECKPNLGLAKMALFLGIWTTLIDFGDFFMPMSTLNSLYTLLLVSHNLMQYTKIDVCYRELHNLLIKDDKDLN